MGVRISSHSRDRFDFPLGRHTVVDASATAKPDAPGPFTRAQMVELLWRVKKIRVTGSASFSYEHSELTAPVTGSVEVDVILTRASDYLVAVVDENELFLQLMGNEFYGAPFAYWSAEIDDSGLGRVVMSPYFGGLPKDDDGYWLTGLFCQAGLGSGELATGQQVVSWEEGGDIETGEWPAGSKTIVLNVDITSQAISPRVIIAATLNLQGTPVDFPLEVYAIDSAVELTGHAASIEITEWFPYATTAGAAAWNTTTGSPSNGGPGA